MHLLLRGGALPTYLLEGIAAATNASAIKPTPPQAVVFLHAENTPEFANLHALIAAEGLSWQFVAENQYPC